MNMSGSKTVTTEELQLTLEPLIRRVIKEELLKIIQVNPQVFSLCPDMPIHKDMKDIAQRAPHDIDLLSHAEVWDE